MTGQEPVAECTECGQDVPVDGIADTRGWEAYRRPAPCWTVGPADDVTAHVEWATVGTDEDSDEGIETFESKNEAVAAAGLWRRRGMTNVYVERHDVSTTRTVVEGEPQAAEQVRVPTTDGDTTIIGATALDRRPHSDFRWDTRTETWEPQAAEPPDPEKDDAIAHMRVQDAIEQRLRDHGAGYEDEPWFADVIDGAAAAALAAAGAVREEER